MLQVKSFTFGLFQTNTYVVSDGQGNILIIDPACCTEYEKQQLLNYISDFKYQNATVQIVATHGHLDHLWGAAWASQQWHTPVLVPEADIPMVEKMQLQYNMFGIPMTAEPFPIEPLQSPITHHPSPMSDFQLLPTPGHTPGSTCLYFPNHPSPVTHHQSPLLFAGDTLFQMGFGRTDLPGGNYHQLIQSLKTLFALPPETKVYAGHGEPTTIGEEKARNMYL